MFKRFLTIAASGMLVLGLALCGAQANAQGGPPEGGHRGHGQRMGGPDQQLQRMSEALKLTDDQKSQIKPILEDRHQKMQSLRSDSSLSEQDKRSKMRSIFEDSNTKIRALLNDDQKQKFDQMQQRMHGGTQKHSETDSK